MLSVFRKNANNWFMVLVFAVITFTFVFTFGSWGGGDVSGQVPIAATVNGSAIPMSTFRVQYSSAFQTMQAYRPGFTAEKAREEKLDDTVLDRLITRELLAQAAEERGLVIGDDEIATAIEERFFPGDKDFDLEEYQRIVNGLYGTTEARYEEQVRREIMAARMETILGDAQHVSESEIKETFMGKNNRADLDLVKIDPLYFKARVKELSDDAAAAWATQHKAEVEKFYTSHMNRFRQGKKVDARHILIKVAEGASDDDKKKARDRIEAASKRVAPAPGGAGEDFAKVASELSEDSSQSKGGSLGTFGEGAMVKPFEEAAWALNKGDISGIVETRFGFHVIKVDDIIEPVTKELKDVEIEIAKELGRDEAQMGEARKYADTVMSALQKGTKMEELKIPGLMKPPVPGQLPSPQPDDAFAPRVDATGPFAQNARVVPKIGVAPEIVKVAFALKPEAPLHPEVLEVSNRLFIVKLKTREEADAKKLAEERDSIEANLLAGRRNAVVEAMTKALRDKARIEKTPNLLDNG
jgi:peptidyl-prolyl cis-trans isomerase D